MQGSGRWRWPREPFTPRCSSNRRGSGSPPSWTWRRRAARPRPPPCGRWPRPWRWRCGTGSGGVEACPPIAPSACPCACGYPTGRRAGPGRAGASRGTGARRDRQVRRRSTANGMAGPDSPRATARGDAARAGVREGRRMRDGHAAGAVARSSRGGRTRRLGRGPRLRGARRHGESRGVQRRAPAASGRSRRLGRQAALSSTSRTSTATAAPRRCGRRPARRSPGSGGRRRLPAGRRGRRRPVRRDPGAPETALEGSLRRLGMDRVHLLPIHRPDPLRHPRETARVRGRGGSARRPA